MAHTHQSANLSDVSIQDLRIEHVFARYQNMFANVRNLAAARINQEVAASVNELFNVLVMYLEEFANEAFNGTKSGLVHEGRKYIPLDVLKSGSKVMQMKLHNLMSSEIDTSCTKLLDLLKTPIQATKQLSQQNRNVAAPNYPPATLSKSTQVKPPPILLQNLLDRNDFHNLQIANANIPRTYPKAYKPPELSKRQLLDKHLLAVHKAKPYTCFEDCSLQFTDLIQLSMHISGNKHRIKKFQCSKCNIHFTGYNLLIMHQEKEHPLKIEVKCREPNCKFTLAAQPDLEKGVSRLTFDKMKDKAGRDMIVLRILDGIDNYLLPDPTADQDPSHNPLTDPLDPVIAPLRDQSLVPFKENEVLIPMMSYSGADGDTETEEDESYDSVSSSEPVPKKPNKRPLGLATDSGGARRKSPRSQKQKPISNEPEMETETETENDESEDGHDEPTGPLSFQEYGLSALRAPTQYSTNCFYCKEGFESRAKTNQHMMSAHKRVKAKQRQYSCVFVACKYQGSSRENVHQHVRSAHLQGVETMFNMDEFYEISDQ